uniref:Kazal-like domain-containing protein n=1 Tax=Erpetoichthys calabaricus TaxID=27687 RepID=A0A8C4XFU2_ERPCA
MVFALFSSTGLARGTSIPPQVRVSSVFFLQHPALVNLDCTNLVNPVCGSDGQTYTITRSSWPSRC